jgi:hypothetical protein
MAEFCQYDTILVRRGQSYWKGFSIENQGVDGVILIHKSKVETISKYVRDSHLIPIALTFNVFVSYTKCVLIEKAKFLPDIYQDYKYGYGYEEDFDYGYDYDGL